MDKSFSEDLVEKQNTSLTIQVPLLADFRPSTAIFLFAWPLKCYCCIVSTVSCHRSF